MDKVILYGLGKNYMRYETVLEKMCLIVGYCDSDVKKIALLPWNKRKKAVLIEDLSSTDIEYDYILITTSLYISEIVKTLNEMGIDNKKIQVFPYWKEYSMIWGVWPLKGVSYSGSWEDLLIDSIREKLKIPYKQMRYIELGVMDPVHGSNTYYFYMRGASGILVEANPHLISNIAGMRERDKLLNRAIYEGEDSKVTLHISKSIGLSSLVREHIEGNPGWEEFPIVEDISVSTIHINDVFEMLGGECDLLAIDIEGYDLEALSALDFNLYRPKIIIAELNGEYLAEKEYYRKIVLLLQSKGYILYANNICNGIFVDQKYEYDLMMLEM